MSCTGDALTALCSRAGDALSAWCPLTGDALTAPCSRTDDASTTLHQCAGDACSCACPATSNRRSKQLRRMSGSPFEPRGSSRWHRARSQSPPHAESSRRHHRSRSPIQGRNSLPDRRGGRTRDNVRPPRQNRTEVFRSSAGSRGRVCVVCLGCHEHNFVKCDDAKLWDGSASGARKNEQGRLVAADSLTLCFDWQLPKGCGSTGHVDRHRCSGCGKADHGAQECPQVEKP